MMKSLLCLLTALVLGFSAGASRAGEAFPPEFDQVPLGRFAPSRSEFFGPLAPAAKRLVLFEKKNRAPQHFCAVGYTHSEGQVNVWVHWKEGKRLLLWRGNSDPDLREKGLIQARRDLKLGKDTVERSDDLKGSTYMTTRAWWEAVAKDCEAQGAKVAMAPFAR